MWSLRSLLVILYSIFTAITIVSTSKEHKTPAADLLPQLSESTDGKELPILSLPIPEDVIHTWPTPNYINPESRKALLLICEIPLIIVTSFAVFGRLYGRGIVAKRWSLGLDDWLMCGSLVRTRCFDCDDF